MTLKICPCCGKLQTTKKAKFLGRQEFGQDMLWFNCEFGGTFVIVSKGIIHGKQTGKRRLES